MTIQSSAQSLALPRASEFFVAKTTDRLSGECCVHDSKPRLEPRQ